MMWISLYPSFPGRNLFLRSSLGSVAYGCSSDNSEVLPELVIDVDRAQVEEGEFYYSYKALTRTSNNIISGTAPTEAEAEELINLFTEGDIIMHKEIIKISIPKNNGTNQS